MNRIGPSVEQKLPPIAARDGDVQIVARGTDDGDLIVDPYPFAEEGASFDIVYTRTDRSKWEDAASYRRDLRVAPHETLTFRCLSV
jgi:hypothetical protein